LQLKLTTQAKILAILELFFRIFALVGFIDSLKLFEQSCSKSFLSPTWRQNKSRRFLTG